MVSFSASAVHADHEDTFAGAARLWPFLAEALGTRDLPNTPAKSLAKKRQLGLLRGDSSGSDPLAYGFWDPEPDVDLALWSGDVDYPDDASAA